MKVDYTPEFGKGLGIFAREPESSECVAMDTNLAKRLEQGEE